MKKIFLLLSIVSLFFILKSPVTASAACPDPCTPGTDWTVSWFDTVYSGGDPDPHTETTYTITAPCKVFFDTDFDITITADDNETANASADTVAMLWALKDYPQTSGGSETLLGGGWNYLDLDTDTDSSGYTDHWERTYTQRYTDIVEDHFIEFSFKELGSRGGAHNWSAQLMGCITVDPLPPTTNEPPVADAGADITINSEDQSLTIVNGSATDADGDSLSYRWLEEGVELQGYAGVGAGGEAPLDLATLSPMTIGGHTLTLEVTDNIEIVTDTVVVSIDNSPPAAVASGAGTYQIFDDLTLGGSVNDYDGDTLTYSWIDSVSGTLVNGTIPAIAGGAPTVLPDTVITGGLDLGVHTVTLQVSDGTNTASSSVVVEYVDSEAPSIAPVATPNILWPPNDEMTQVLVSANTTDNSGAQPSITVMLTSNEAQGANIDYSVENIDQATGIVSLLLRAERSGVGAGREYTVTITATDASSNASSASVVVLVPHERSKK